MASSAAMEQKIQRLASASEEQNRATWALEWKKQGKKVAGIFGPGDVPEEILYAAEVLPWRMIGTWRESIPLGAQYRPEFTCRYCAHVLESLLAGEMSFLDGVASTTWDDDVRHAWYTMEFLGTPAYTHILHLPLMNSQLGLEKWAANVALFKADIEKWVGHDITDAQLRAAVDTYNTTRKLIGRLYEMRKQEVPPLSGAEMLGITTAALIMPKDEFNNELESLMPYLAERKAPVKRTSPRIMVSADYLDNPAYVKMIEDGGCLVAMDDTDTGARHFTRLVEPAGDVVKAIADRYLLAPGSPRMFEWDRQAKQALEWAKEYRIDGVVEMPLMYSFPRHFRDAYFTKTVADTGLPLLNVKREYHVGAIGQLRTRIEAFLEMLEQ